MENAATFPFPGMRLRAARLAGFAAGRGRGPWRHRGHGGPHEHGHHEHHAHHGHGPGFGPGFEHWARGFGGPGFGGFGGGRGGFGFPFGGPRRRRGGRAGRGDIRLAALALLADQPMHGYQLMREISTRSNGVWRPSPGAVYPALQQLEDEGLVEADKAEGKRIFRLTAEGTRYVQEHRTEIDAVWDSVNDDVDDSWQDLAQVGGQVMQAFMQVASAGSARQLAEARELMVETRRKLYRILAEDDTGASTDEPGDADPDERD